MGLKLSVHEEQQACCTFKIELLQTQGVNICENNVSDHDSNESEKNEIHNIDKMNK